MTVDRGTEMCITETSLRCKSSDFPQPTPLPTKTSQEFHAHLGAVSCCDKWLNSHDFMQYGFYCTSMFSLEFLFFYNNKVFKIKLS